MEYLPFKIWVKYTAAGLSILVAVTFVLCVNWYQSTQSRNITSETLAKLQLKRQLILNMHNAIHNRAVSLSRMISLSDPFEFDDEYLRFSSYASHFINSKNILLEYHVKEKDESQKWVNLLNVSKISSQAANLSVEYVINSQQNLALQHYLTTFTPAINKIAALFRERLQAVNQQEKIQIEQYSAHEHVTDNLVSYIIAAFASLGLVSFVFLALFIKLYYRSIYAVSTKIGDLAMLVSRQKDISSEGKIKRLLEYGCFLLQMDTGSLSKLSDDSSKALLLQYHSTVENLEIGTAIPTDNTFCSSIHTNVDEIIALNKYDGSSQDKPLLYNQSTWSSYIACKMYRDDNIYGVLYFSSQTRVHEFSPTMKNILCLLSGWIGYILNEKFSAEELRQTRLDADTANTLKNSFLSNISHELRTPLNAIIGYSDLLVDELADSDDKTFMQDAKRITDSGTHLLSLINEILDLSYIESGKFDLSSDYFYFNRVIDKVSRSVSPEMSQNNNVFEFDKSAVDIMLYTDKARLTQVLTTILTIAGQFNNNTKIHLGATTRHVSGKDWLDINITDFGTKMSDQQLARIFKPFTQADGAYNVVYGGTGLALTISKRICQLMGGTITVQNDQQSNVIFTVSIPSNVISQHYIRFFKTA